MRDGRCLRFGNDHSEDRSRDDDCRLDRDQSEAVPAEPAFERMVLIADSRRRPRGRRDAEERRGESGEPEPN